MMKFLIPLVVFVTATFIGRSQESPEPPPNLIIIFIDDMGYGDLSSYGNSRIQTPNIDLLARQGRRFTQFYVNSPICSPSRVALLTGQYPMRWRIHSYLDSREANARRRMADYLDTTAVTLAEVLRSSGYATGHFGKWHIGGGRDVGDAPRPQAYGFDKSLVSFEGLGDRLLQPDHQLSTMSGQLEQGEIQWMPKYKFTETYVDSAVAFVHRHREGPFYINLWPNDVHDPHLPMPGVSAKYDSLTANPYERDFFAVLETLDEQLGRFIQSLDTMELMSNTVIVLTSDNGPTDWPRYYQEGVEPPGSTGGLKGRKWSLYEGGIRMPFLVHWPDRVSPGVDESTVLSAIDLMPTLTNLLRVPLPDSLEIDGQDRSAAILEGPQPHDDIIFWEYGSGVGGSILPGEESNRSPTLAVRQGDWKLLINTDSTQAALFNMAEDPEERQDLVEEEADRARDLAGKLLRWRRALPVEMIAPATTE